MPNFLARPASPVFRRGHRLAAGSVGGWPILGSMAPLDVVGANRLTPSGGVTTDTGPHGPTLRFSGVTQFCVGSGYELASGFTLATWFLSATTAAFRGILSVSNAAKTRFELGLNSTGQVFFHYGTASRSSTAPRVDNSAWHFLLATWDGTTPLLWIDGVSAALGAPGGAGAVALNASSMRLGDLGPTAFYLNGQIGFAWVWNRPLPASAIPDLYADSWRMMRAGGSAVPLIAGIPAVGGGYKVWYAGSGRGAAVGGGVL